VIIKQILINLNQTFRF